MKRMRIGTRGSPLALAQAGMVRDALRRVRPDLETDIVVITTSGDWKPSDGEVALAADKGGKALFAKEIEAALLAGDIDIAVHSMKDMESFLPEGLCIPWMLPRADARDALILNDLSKNVQKIDDLPMGCVVGTSSVRRAAFLRAKRPDLRIEVLRGNVQTRLDKLKNGQVDVTLLAVAGLSRLGLAHEIGCILPEGDMLPASAQGAVGIETRVDLVSDLSFIGQISCGNTVCCVSAEREVLRVLSGSCHTPVGAYAVLDDGAMWLRAALCAPDGTACYAVEGHGVVSGVDEARALGRRVGLALKDKVPPAVLAQVTGQTTGQESGARSARHEQ